MPILSSVISDFMDKSRNLCNRLRSPEAVNVSTADLNLLREQLKVLDSQVTHVLNQKNTQVAQAKSMPTPSDSTAYSLKNSLPPRPINLVTLPSQLRVDA